MADKHPGYWKVKAAFLATDLAKRDAERHVAQMQEKLSQAMTEAGLDPEKAYDLVDATESITERAL